MCRKLIYLVSFVLVLGLVLTRSAEADLVGWWKFDEGSGTTVLDSSGNENHGTTFDNVNWAEGKTGFALEFDGASGHVEVPHSESLKLLNAGDFTIAAWCLLNEAPPTTNRVILQQGDRNGTGRTLLFVHTSNEVRSFIGGATSGSGVGVEAGVWTHLAVTVTEGGATDIVQLYVNGEPAGTPTEQNVEDCEGDYFLCSHKNLANVWDGLIDDFRLYNHALSQAELFKLAVGPKASKPSLEDGALHADTWVNLGWRSGVYAASHDVYLGDSFDDVNDAVRDSDVFRGNQTATSFIVGITGFAYPDGLAPGTTYYWRIDEVNDADPNSPWKGDVWSFFVPPRKAYEPGPTDGVKNVLQDVTLNWTPGINATLHTVYFGSSFDDVNSATGGAPQPDATYTPETLESDTIYYWRVDEFDGSATHKGDTWNFATVPYVEVTDPNLALWWTLDEGEGTTAVDWSGHGNHGAINGKTQWTDGYQGTALMFGSDVYVETTEYPGVTGTSARTLCAWIKTSTANRTIMSWGQNSTGQKWRMYPNGSTGTLRIEVNGGYNYGVTNIADGRWHHVAVTFEDDGTPDVLDALLYVDGQLDATAASADEPIDTATTGLVRIGESPWHNQPFDGIIDDARIYDKVLTAEEIQQVMLGDTKLAGNPVPNRDEVVDIRDISSLSFSAGATAASHDVYIGTNRDAVAAATNDSPEFQGNQAGTSLSVDGLAEFGGGDYYWRIDEVEADATVITGTIWKFTVPDYLSVDDFEVYDAGNKEIWWSWKDGLGYAEHDNEPAYAGNGTGAAVGDENSFTYMETSIVHGGGQSMPLWYDNNKQGYAKYSEVELTLPADKRDWTVESVGELSLWFRGESDNAAERLFVAVADTAVVYHDDPNAAQITTWNEWVIPLETLADQGVTLTSVDRIALGLGTRGNAITPGGAGKMYFDDIRLNKP